WRQSTQQYCVEDDRDETDDSGHFESPSVISLINSLAMIGSSRYSRASCSTRRWRAQASFCDSRHVKRECSGREARERADALSGAGVAMRVGREEKRIAGVSGVALEGPLPDQGLSAEASGRPRRRLPQTVSERLASWTSRRCPRWNDRSYS